MRRRKIERRYSKVGMHFDAYDKVLESCSYDMMMELCYDMGLKDDPDWPRCGVPFLTACHLYMTMHMNNLEDDED